MTSILVWKPSVMPELDARLERLHFLWKSYQEQPVAGVELANVVYTYRRVLGLIHRAIASHETDVLRILARAGQDVTLLERQVREAIQPVDRCAGELGYPTVLAP